MSVAEVKKVFPGKIQAFREDVSDRWLYAALLAPNYEIAGCRFILNFWFLRSTNTLTLLDMYLTDDPSGSTPIKDARAVKDIVKFLRCVDRTETFMLKSFGRPDSRDSKDMGIILEHRLKWYLNGNKIEFSTAYYEYSKEGTLLIGIQPAGLEESLLGSQSE